MYAVRSNTGRAFTRSGVTFAPNQWKLLEEVTPEQLAEMSSPMKALLILEDVQLNDARFGGFEVDTSIVDPELTVGVPADAAALREEMEELRAKNEAFRDCIALLENENAQYRAEVGELLPEEHPDEAKPRAGTWLQERRNWQAEVEQARAYIHKTEPIVGRVQALEAELSKRDKKDALEALNVPELVTRAQEAGIVGAADMKKAELIEALLRAE